MYFNPTANYIYQAFQMYCGAYKMHNVDGRGRFTWLNSFTGNTDIAFTLDGGGSRITTNAFSTSYWQVGYTHSYLGNIVCQIKINNATHGQIEVANSVGTVTNVIGGGRSTEPTWFKEGLVLGGTRGRTATPFFDVMGAGATSATTTALFQNSASVTALKVKDDLYCIFRAKDAVIPDADLGNNELSFYIEESSNDLHFKVKYSTGTVKSGKINLT
jgi:hypothetical protein